MLPFETQTLQNLYQITINASGKDDTGTASLENTANLIGLLEEFGRAIQSSDRTVVGSLFIKRYCQLIAGALYVWTLHRYGLDLSLRNVGIALQGRSLSFLIRNPDEPDRLKRVRSPEQKTDLYLKHLLQENASRVFQPVVRFSKVPESTLWATLSYSFAYWKEEWVRNTESKALKNHIQDMYRRVSDKTETGWFDDKNCNPLSCKFRSVCCPLTPDKQILVREKCCLNYRLSGDDRYCYTCPLISDERRIQKYIEAHVPTTC